MARPFLVENLLNDEVGLLVVQQAKTSPGNHLLNDDVVQQSGCEAIE